MCRGSATNEITSPQRMKMRWRTRDRHAKTKTASADYDDSALRRMDDDDPATAPGRSDDEPLLKNVGSGQALRTVGDDRQ